MSFTIDLQNFKSKVEARANAVVRKIVLDVGTALVLKSPVGDASYWTHPAPPGYVGGRFRANWQYGLDVPTGALPDIDANGGNTIGRISANIATDAAGRVHYLVNKLPYGPALEHGWSRQAPQGMVGLTVLQFQKTVQDAAQALKNT